MRAAVLAPIALALVLVAGCGGDDGNGEAAKKGPQVAADAAKALKDAGAAHVTGIGTQDGKTVSLDLHFQGADAKGSITEGGATLQVINVGGKLYAQAPAAFWSSQGLPAASGSALAGKWVILPATGGSVLPISLDTLAKDLEKPTDGTTIEDKVSTSTYQGQKVVVVTSSDKSAVQVAATGKPYPVHADSKGKDPGTFTLTDFGKKTTITAPAGALDLSQLAGGN